MTPKEKAKELFEKYLLKLKSSKLDICYKGDLWKEQINTAKECAVVFIEEVEKKIVDQISEDYWSDVKEELKKIA